MWPDRVSNPEPLTFESGVLPTALCGPAKVNEALIQHIPYALLCKKIQNVSLYSSQLIFSKMMFLCTS